MPADEPLLGGTCAGTGAGSSPSATEDADVHVVAEERRGESTHVLLDAFGHRARLDFSFTGGHYLLDALAAVAAFVELGFRLDEAAEGAAQVAFSDLRGAVSALPGGGLLLNDAYNANPVAMKAAVDHLVAIADGRPMVAVLGDMYELGAGAGTPITTPSASTAPPGASAWSPSATSRGTTSPARPASAGSRPWTSAWRRCPRSAPAGSAVLVKASRLMRMERVAEALAAEGAPRA